MEIVPTDDWTEIAEKLETLSSSRIQSVFERVVNWFSELMEKTILLMIDEYEFLFRTALDNTAGFMKLRSMSSKTLPNGLRPFCFWLTGSTPWDQLITEIPGSGEANTISNREFVPPISKESFHDMWHDECDIIDDVQKKQLLLTSENFAYDMSGGIPFYGKNMIGFHIYKNGNHPDYTICQTHFQELTQKALNKGLYKILKDLSLGSRKMAKSNNLSFLESMGIIEANSKGLYSITIGFLNDYIRAELADAPAAQLPETYSLMADITKIIEDINNQRKNQHKTVVFEPVLDIETLGNKLRTPCRSRDQLSTFATSLYLYYYERLKQNRSEFNRYLYSTFGNCVDMARHSLGGAHEMDFFQQNNRQFSRADLFREIMGNTDELSCSDEYYRFQLGMLKKFKNELVAMFCAMKGTRR